MTYTEACEQAKTESAKHHCTQHVCAVLLKATGGGKIIGYRVADWFDGTVLTSFTNGKEHG